MAQPLMTINQVCEYLNIDRKTLYTYIKEGRIKPRRLPSGRPRFTQKQVDGLLKKGGE